MRPRGPSRSSPSTRYVGQASRQKPQCTQRWMSSRASRPGPLVAWGPRGSVYMRASGVLETGVHAAGVQNAGRVEDLLERAVQAQHRSRERRKDLFLTHRAAKESRRAAGLHRNRGEILAFAVVIPTLHALPFEKRGVIQ